MQVFMYGGCMLLGFVLGYFLQTGVLIAISALSIGIAVWMLVTARELATLLAMLVAWFVGILNLTMWVTWYFASHQTFIQDFFQNHILR